MNTTYSYLPPLIIIAGSMELIVVALGGNALLSPSGGQSFSKERSNMDRISRSIVELCKREKCNVVITHGNGSQVGDEIMRNEHAKKFIPQLPLYILNAETQAQIGSIIETSIRNSLQRLKIKREVSTILAHVLVDKGDGAFRSPTKQVGPFYTKGELNKELKLDRFDYIKLKGKYRHVVASPKPKRILEIDSIRVQCEKGIVITCGGGGIPTTKENGRLMGINAVIDKDLTTQLLANSIKAKRMVILTNTDYVYVDYNGTQHPVGAISSERLAKLIPESEAGTIRPKLEACMNFIENGGKEAYIGNIFKLDLILKGMSGTKIY